MLLTLYKNRKVNLYKPVYAYRCLNNKDFLYSIMQNGLVVAHTNSILIRDASFIVRPGGLAKVRREQRKNVHAFVKGFLVESGMGIGSDKNLPAKITYNPYLNDSFICENLIKKVVKVSGATMVVLNQYGCSGAYLS